ncbi:hypothetical protein LguiA_021278 [Lonicera macranthoides]
MCGGREVDEDEEVEVEAGEHCSHVSSTKFCQPQEDTCPSTSTIDFEPKISLSFLNAGAEVKPGELVKAKPDVKKLIHVSQVALGDKENNKGVDSVSLHMKMNDVKFHLGTLSAKNRPQMILDLVFEKEFELSHDWEDGSVYFIGYKRDNLNLNAYPSRHNLEEEKCPGQSATLEKEAIVDPMEDEESEELGSSYNDLSGDDESTSGSDESDESTSEEDEDVQISFSYAPTRLIKPIILVSLFFLYPGHLLLLGAHRLSNRAQP